MKGKFVGVDVKCSFRIFLGVAASGSGSSAGETVASPWFSTTRT